MNPPSLLTMRNMAGSFEKGEYYETVNDMKMIRKKHFYDLEKSGSFFYTQNQGDKIMDINKLFYKVIEDEDVKDIPLIFVLAVVNSVIEAINSGECFYPTEIE